jgi:hypothetical protein
VRPGCALRADDAALAARTLRAILDARELGVDLLQHFRAQDRDRCAHIADRALRLRLDQRALALPLAAFICEHFAERFTPRLKQSVGGQCVRRLEGCV